MADIIDFNSKQNKDATPPAPPTIKKGRVKFYMHKTDEEGNGGTVEAEGYLKFGPAFIAVVDGPEDASNVLVAVATGMVKHLERTNIEE